LAGNKADNWFLRQCPAVLNLPFRDDVKRPDRDNAIDVYVTGEGIDELAKEWPRLFTALPPFLSPEQKSTWLKKMKGVALASDAFFPFGDNIERAARSGVSYIAQSGGSIRDDNVIETCDKYGIAMAMTHIRLFHH
jgi:AICAR transformylase/IMP cyclohydrolase PurH